jgi:hypothetical protein
LEPGSYSVRVDGEGQGSVYMDDALVAEFEYDVRAPLGVGAQQTVDVPGFFEFDLRSQVAADLGGLGESLFDGCHFVLVEAAIQLVEGEVYDVILLEELVIEPDAPSGTYTFFAESGNAGVVELRLDGAAVDTLEYAWQTSIGGGNSFTFEFPGVVMLTVTRPMGTSNLFTLAANLFDGRHELEVP